MPVASLTTIALVLGLYATGVSTIVALVTLYGEVFARVDVIAREAYLVPVEGRQALIVVGDDALQAIGGADAARLDVLTIAIRNRGRRPVQIRVVSKVGDDGFYTLDDL